MTIYRGYTIQHEPATQFPYKVYDKDGNYIWAGRTEDEALSFIDKSKRALNK
jgi:hypothetical protein